MDSEDLAERLWPSASPAAAPAATPKASEPAAPAPSPAPTVKTTPSLISDEARIAKALWGESATTQEPKGSPPPSEKVEQATAAKMYPEPKAPPAANNVPEAIKELRAADAERKLYTPAKAYSESIKVEDFASVKHLVSADDVIEFREVAADLGLGPADALEIVTIAKSTPPTVKEQAEWRDQTITNIAMRHTGNEQEALAEINLVRTFVRLDPRIAKTMEALKIEHLGDHPRVYEMLLSRALAARLAGRF